MRAGESSWQDGRIHTHLSSDDGDGEGDEDTHCDLPPADLVPKHAKVHSHAEDDGHDQQGDPDFGGGVLVPLESLAGLISRGLGGGGWLVVHDVGHVEHGEGALVAVDLLRLAVHRGGEVVREVVGGRAGDLRDSLVILLPRVLRVPGPLAAPLQERWWVRTCVYVRVRVGESAVSSWDVLVAVFLHADDQSAI